MLRGSLNSREAAGIGFEFAKNFKIPCIGVLGDLLMSSANLDQAFNYYGKYHILLSHYCSIVVSECCDSYSIVFKRLFSADEDDCVKCFLAESLFSLLLQGARTLSGSPVCFDKIYMPYKKPEHFRQYADNLECQVLFSYESVKEESMRLVVSKKMMSTLIPTGDEVIRAFKEYKVKEKIYNLDKLFSVEEIIPAILESSYPQTPNQKEMARVLNMSQSSFYRRLKAANTSYQEIVDQHKKEMAVYELSFNSSSISDVSEKLMFSDAASFARAFRKWTGYTPSQYKKIIMNESVGFIV